VLAKHGAPDARRIGSVALGRSVELPGLGLTYAGYAKRSGRRA
jgi:hypothetical protein